MKRPEPIIIVKDLVKSFGPFVANDHLNFEVQQGEIFGFLGANGAGKTTAIRILSGLSTPTSGEVTVCGYNARNQSEQIKRAIGYMSQRFSLYDDLTIKENIQLFGGIYGLKRKEIQIRSMALLNNLGFKSIQNRLLSTIPLGWKQKLAFSVAVLHKPKLVFLDEPTGGVDPITRRQFWELIYEASSQGITIFVTTHYMDEAEYCDRVCILADGQIRAIGNPQILKRTYQAADMELVFFKIVTGEDGG